MKPKISLLVFAILILSDLFIGAWGHFTGSTDEVSIDSLIDYFTAEETRNELFMVLIVAVAIVLFLHFTLGV